MIRSVTLLLLLFALGGCVQRAATMPPSLYAETLQSACEPSAYVRPPDELERPVMPDEQAAPAHEHGHSMEGHSMDGPSMQGEAMDGGSMGGAPTGGAGAHEHGGGTP